MLPAPTFSGISVHVILSESIRYFEYPKGGTQTVIILSSDSFAATLELTAGFHFDQLEHAKRNGSRRLALGGNLFKATQRQRVRFLRRIRSSRREGT